MSSRWRRSSVYFEVSNIDTLPSPARLEPAHQDRTYYSTGGSSNNNNNFVLRRMHRWQVGALPGLSVRLNTSASGYEANTSNGTSINQTSREGGGKLVGQCCSWALGLGTPHPSPARKDIWTSKRNPWCSLNPQHKCSTCVCGATRPPTSGASYIQHLALQVFCMAETPKKIPSPSGIQAT